MVTNKWWFTMMWDRGDGDWVMSHVHHGAMNVLSGAFSSGHDTERANELWIKYALGMSIGSDHRPPIDSGPGRKFCLMIDHAPERPSYDAFVPPRYTYYDLDVET